MGPRERALKERPAGGGRARKAAAPGGGAAEILALQRVAGNRATALLVGRSGLGRRAIQRVGEEKISYVAREKALETSVRLLAEALETVNKARREIKAEQERELNERMPPKATKERQALVMQRYPDALSFANGLHALSATEAFTSGALRLGDTDGDFVVVLDDQDRPIADLSVGEASFLPALEDPDAPFPETQRTQYTRLHDERKEYVDDSRDVPTRRYAYVEKSFHQFMELLHVGVMLGRYQILLKALNEATGDDLLRVSPGLGGLLTRDGGRISRLNLEQLALLHQWMGTGMGQRGLSLTSTPRERAVFANEGDSFRTGDGVRLKIDLLKVPKDVVLINHYAQGGVKDSTDTLNPSLVENTPPTDGRRARYGYKRSVTKNRELYLQYLLPDWIVEVQVHGKAKFTGAPGPELVTQGGAAAGGDAYAKGFARGVDAAIHKSTPPPTGDAAFDKGLDAGALYFKGHLAGTTEGPEFVTALNLARGTIETTLRQNAKKTEEEQLKSARGKASSLKTKKPTTPTELAKNLVADAVMGEGIEAMRELSASGWTAITTLARGQDEYDLYWIGWAHGASGQEPRRTMDRDFY